MKTYCVYILTTKNNQLLYIGVTNSLERRLYEHKNNLVEWYTSKYSIHKLVYYESCGSIVDAIAREKQLKGWLRKKKNELISLSNPNREEIIA